jgi:AraC family transcriptional regulator
MADQGQSNPSQDFRLIQHLPLSNFILNEDVVKQGVSVPRHSHEQAHLTLIVEGHCQENYQGKARELAPLTAIYFHPGESHAIQVFDQPLRTFDIEFNSVWLKRLLSKPIATDALLEKPSPSISELTTRLYLEFKELDEVAHLAMEGLALEILANLARASKNGKSKTAPRWLRRVVEMVRDEFARPLSLTELAQVAGVHPSHLAQVFRQHQHCTPGEFIRRVRVEQAVQLLAEPDLSLAEISLATGFSDQSHFSRIFKRVTGLTPARFRQLKLDANSVQNTRESCKTRTEQ